MPLAPKIPVETKITTYPLEEANRVLQNVRKAIFEGSAVHQIHLLISVVLGDYKPVVACGRYCSPPTSSNTAFSFSAEFNRCS